MDLGIAGRRAVVGGGSSGLGLAVADALAAEGCRLVLWARRAERLERAAADLHRRHGTEVRTIVADASEAGAAGRVADGAREALGGVDILVLNAGGPPPVDPAATDPAGWATAIQLLAVTPIELATRLLPDTRRSGWGRIAAILSYTIRQPVDTLAYSNAGRSALAAWLKTVSRAVAADGVSVNGVLPGRFDTPRIEELDRLAAERSGRTAAAVRADLEAGIPAGRYGRPEEFAALVAFLCSERAGYLTGTATAVDGGLIAGLP